MSKGAKQTLFIALAAVVIVAMVYAFGTNKTTSSSAPVQGTQVAQQDQIDPAILDRIKTLEDNLKANNKDTKTISELGQLYFQIGQLDKANTIFAAGLQIEPNNATFHNYIGLTYFWNGQSKEAIDEYKKAIEADPNAPDAYYNLALAQSHSQPSDIPGAIANWQKVIELAPGSSMAQKSQDYIDKNKTGTPQAGTAPPLNQPKP